MESDDQGQRQGVKEGVWSPRLGQLLSSSGDEPGLKNTCVDAPLAEEATFRETGGPYDLPDHVHFSHGPGRGKI